MASISVAQDAAQSNFAVAVESVGRSLVPVRDRRPWLRRRGQGEAALRRFYGPTHTPAFGVLRRSIVVLIGGASAWAVVFGAGALLLH